MSISKLINSQATTSQAGRPSYADDGSKTPGSTRDTADGMFEALVSARDARTEKSQAAAEKETALPAKARRESAQPAKRPLGNLEPRRVQQRPQEPRAAFPSRKPSEQSFAEPRSNQKPSQRDSRNISQAATTSGRTANAQSYASRQPRNQDEPVVGRRVTAEERVNSKGAQPSGLDVAEKDNEKEEGSTVEQPMLMVDKNGIPVALAGNGVAGVMTSGKIVGKELSVQDVKDIAAVLTKNRPLVQEAPALALMTGKLEYVDPATIPNLVSETPFIKDGLQAENIDRLLDQPLTIRQIFESMNFDKKVMALAENLGIDLNGLTTAREFLHLGGVDTQVLATEIGLLRANLPLEGLTGYMARARALYRGPYDQSAETVEGSGPLVVMNRQGAGASGAKHNGPQPMDLNGVAADATDAAHPEGAGSQPFNRLDPYAESPVELEDYQVIETIQGQNVRDHLQRQIRASAMEPISANGPEQKFAKSATPLDLTGQGQSSGTDAIIDSRQVTAADPFVAITAKYQGDVTKIAADDLHQGRVGLQSLDAGMIDEKIVSRGDGVADVGQVEPLAKSTATEAQKLFAQALIKQNRQEGAESGVGETVGLLGTESAGVLDKLNRPALARHLAYMPDITDGAEADNMTLETRSTEAFVPNTSLGSFVGSGLGSGSDQGTFDRRSSQEQQLNEIRIGNQESSRIQDRHQTKFMPMQQLVDPSHSSNVDRVELVQQILNKSSLMLKSGGGAMRVSFETSEMGQLDLAVQVNDQKMDLRIVASSDKVRDALIGELPRIREMLIAQNLQLDSVEVGVNGRQSGGAGDQAFARNQYQNGANQGDVPGFMPKNAQPRQSWQRAATRTAYKPQHTGSIQVLA